jgi:glutaredoxin 3
MLLTIVSSLGVLCGKFLLDAEPLTYLGIGTMILASLWNSWPRSPASYLSCSACASEEESQIKRHIGGSDMTTKRKIELFSAGCSICKDAIELVRRVSCPSCEVTVLDMHDAEVAKRARQYNISTLPAVVVDGKLAGCCVGVGVTEEELRKAGTGSAR